MDAQNPTATRVLHGISLTGTREVASGVFASRDSGGMLRLHDDQAFLGYVGKWSGGRWHLCIFSHPLDGMLNGPRRKLDRYDYKTQKGAERQLVARAGAIVLGR